MINLIRNENMKIYRRLRTWIMFGLLVGLVVLVSLVANNVQAPAGVDWRTNIEAENNMFRQQLSEGILPEMAKRQAEQSIKLNEYRLAHDIPPAGQTLWGMVKSLSNLVMMITIFTVIVAGDSVAGEFTGGTIKLLLIRPVNRSKILLSKYIAAFLFCLMMLATLLVASIIVNGVLYGFDSLTVPDLRIDAAGNIIERSMLVSVLAIYGLKCVELIMVVTLAFMISTVFRSSSLAIGLSIFMMFAGPTASIFLARYAWGKYWLFMNTDLTQYLVDTPFMEGLTLPFSIAVLAVYFILFNALSWTLFNKRDIAA